MKRFKRKAAWRYGEKRKSGSQNKETEDAKHSPLIIVALREVTARRMEVPHAVDVAACRGVTQIGVGVLRRLVCSDLCAVCFEERDNLCMIVSCRIVERRASPTVGAIEVDVALRYEEHYNLQLSLRRAEMECRPA